MRFTPHLWERNKSKRLAELKKLRLRQDLGGGSSVGLPSYLLVNSLWRPRNPFLHLGMATGRVGGDQVSPSSWMAFFPYLPEWLLINPSCSQPGSGLLEVSTAPLDHISIKSSHTPDPPPQGHNFPLWFIVGQFACAFLSLLPTGGRGKGSGLLGRPSPLPPQLSTGARAWSSPAGLQ